MDGVSQVSGLSDQLRLSASKGQLHQVEDCLKAGGTFNVDQDGRTALHYAALNGFTDVTRFLIDKGCNTNIQDDSGYTALHRAASQGHLEVITVLLECGCDVNTQDEHGNAAIHEAAWNGFSKTLELLVKHDVNCTVVNKAGFTALHLAAQNGHNESSRVLLYAGCNSDARNNYGDTALHTAARYGHAGVTRILISARAKLNEQNKNGDTALHIAAALKRRKIAKLLVESGTDVHMKNKQSETAVDVARRKEHHEIISIVQTFLQSQASKVPRPHAREVNFKEGLPHEIDGPVVVPDQDPPGKPEAKQEKGKKFFFFKKKKTKEKNGGVTQQKAVPGCQVHVNRTPVQGFFSKYVPREGVQYYRDLAGNVKQGPVGYTPQCNCLPAMHRLEKTVADTHDDVYGRMHTTQTAMHQRLDKLDQRQAMRVHDLEQYTREQFGEEDQRCRQRISEKMNEKDDKMKMQIQDWLEEKLEGYGHCLHHHHDDSVLPNENIFSEVHETANGRLFKSRSDETLSQSDNHSGKFRKRDFYESRTAAMQQMRAWQVPSYSKDRNKVQVRSDPPQRGGQVRTDTQQRSGQGRSDAPQRASQGRGDPMPRPAQRSQSKQQLNMQTDQRRYYPVEPEIQVRNPSRVVQDSQFSVPSDRTLHQTLGDESDYVTMNGVQHGAVPKQTQGMHQSQSYQPADRTGIGAPLEHKSQSFQPGTQSYQPGNQRSGNRGPVNHSTPKGAVSDNYDSVAGLTRSQTDSGINNRLQSDLQHHSIVTSESSSNFKPRLPDRPVSTIAAQPSSSRQLVFQNSEQECNSPVKNSPRASSTFRNSVSSDSLLPKPTFTTFGYDGEADNTDGRQAPANSPNQKGERPSHLSEAAQRLSSPRINSDVNYSNSSNQQQASVHPTTVLHESQNSLGFVPTHVDDNYVDMGFSSRSHRLHQRARSAEGLLDDEAGFSRNTTSPYVGGSPHTLDSTRSSSAPRSSMGPSVSSSPSTNSVAQVRPDQNGYPRTSSHSIYSANSSTTSPMSYKTSRAPPPTSPKPKPNSQPYSPYSSVRDVQTNSAQFRGSPSTFRTTDNVNSAKDGVYSTPRDVKMPTDNNHNLTVKADVHMPNTNSYLSQTAVNNRTNMRTPNQSDSLSRQQAVILEPRSQTAYQTYLTEDVQVQSGNMFQRENSPNVCNNSKEDSSSNPDSGYSSKIYGNRGNNSATPASASSTPSSSFSTDRGISLPSNNNSPQSQYSNGDYESLPKKQYYDEVQSHMHNWYQRKLQETTQKVYDNWRTDQSPAGKNFQNGRNPLPVRSYGKDDYAKIPYNYSQDVGAGQPSGQQVYGDYGGLSSYGQMNSHLAMRGSDV